MKRRILLSLLFVFSIAVVQAKTILVVGDSLSAGYNIDKGYSWVNLLNMRLSHVSNPYQVINISTSGDTTSNGLAKLPAALATYKPTIVIIELGTNDGLLGLPLAGMRHNLITMIMQSQKNNAKVLLLATLLPSNHNAKFLSQFNQVYADLAAHYQTALIPMFLQGLAGDPTLIQADGLHPTQQAQQKILDNIWPILKPML